MAETVPVDFRLLGIDYIRGGGKLAALANVEVDIAGVVIALQGVRVMGDGAGGLSVRAPAFRTATGVWQSAVILPDSLRDALGAEVLAALQADHGGRPIAA